jgi:hypothetical protein
VRNAQEKSAEMEIKNLYRGITNKMDSHIKNISKSFNHGSEQGSSNEKILIRFLSDYLPKKYAVDSGFVIFPDGHSSKQTDIIIYDAINCPPIYTEEGFLVAAFESICAIVEIKTTLTKQTFIDANEKAFSVTGDLDNYIKNYKKRYEIPFITICFAFQNKNTLDSICDIAQELKDDKKLYLDFICVLNEGVIINVIKKEKLLISYAKEDTLLYFMAILLDFMKRIPQKDYSFMDYLIKPTQIDDKDK